MKTARYKSSKYKYVKKEERNGKTKWLVKMPGISMKRYDDERGAAKAADLHLIKKGKKPVNVLKRK